tara:strand:- start:224 stop:1036 length:813 start_codon:yes stop_codon:yes gene_type:complete
MRKITYTNLQTKIQRLLGVDSLLTAEQNSILTAVNKYARLAWERAAWPEVCATEQRAVNGRVGSVTVDSGGSSYTSAPNILFSSGGATATSTIKDNVVNSILVTDGGANYTTAPDVSFSGGAGSGASATASLNFTVDYEGVYPFIGDFFQIYKNDPWKTAYPQELSFRLNEDGALMQNKTDSTPVFVHYRKRFKDYVSTSTDLPYVFEQYMAQGAFADMMLVDGQHDKSNNALAIAEQMILSEVDKLERQQSQQTHTMTLTHVNQQNRIY